MSSLYRSRCLHFMEQYLRFPISSDVPQERHSLIFVFSEVVGFIFCSCPILPIYLSRCSRQVKKYFVVIQKEESVLN